ncbi:putative F-box domain-containing protein [Tanacetum coccineum]
MEACYRVPTLSMLCPPNGCYLEPINHEIDWFIFWVAIDVVSSFKYLILSFDLITHEFKEVNLPVSIANQVSLDISISRLNESLVVSACTNEVNGLVYGVWMMGEEGGVMTSFTNLFTVNTPDLSLSLRRLLGFRKSGQPIMETVADRPVRKHCFCLINKIVILFPTVIEEEDDGSGARCETRNDRVLEAYKGFVELGFIKLSQS